MLSFFLFFRNLLSYVSENERICIKQRQAEEIAATKAKGVKFGSPEKPLPNNFSEYCKMYGERKISIYIVFDFCLCTYTHFGLSKILGLNIQESI